jgi:hypothetical protein
MRSTGPARRQTSGHDARRGGMPNFRLTFHCGSAAYLEARHNPRLVSSSKFQAAPISGFSAELKFALKVLSGLWVEIRAEAQTGGAGAYQSSAQAGEEGTAAPRGPSEADHAHRQLRRAQPFPFHASRPACRAPAAKAWARLHRRFRAAARRSLPAADMWHRLPDRAFLESGYWVSFRCRPQADREARPQKWAVLAALHERT